MRLASEEKIIIILKYIIWQVQGMTLSIPIHIYPLKR